MTLFSRSTLAALPFAARPLAALLCGCSSESGSVTAVAYGEEFIEEGIPADTVDDGWAIHFDHYRVTIRDVTVGGSTLDDAVTVDLTEPSDGEGQELGSLELSPGDYTDSSFVIDRVEVEGSAEKDDETKTFSWVFDQAIAYGECDTTTEVTSGEAARFQVTVHADHMFYDSTVSTHPQLLFQPLADADSDGDGEIEEAELWETDIGAYDPGSAGGIDDLWAFLEAQARTLGHVDGEGHCHGAEVD